MLAAQTEIRGGKMEKQKKTKQNEQRCSLLSWLTDARRGSAGLLSCALITERLAGKVAALTRFSCSNSTFGCSFNCKVWNGNGVCGWNVLLSVVVGRVWQFHAAQPASQICYCRGNSQSKMSSTPPPKKKTESRNTILGGDLGERLKVSKSSSTWDNAMSIRILWNVEHWAWVLLLPFHSMTGYFPFKAMRRFP